jgi:uncharacterized protein YcbX
VRPTGTGLFRYPVKSCRGEQLGTATVEPWGLAGDRRWMIVDEAGEAVTARARQGLVLVTAGHACPRDPIEIVEIMQ